jgi:pyruvate kinase
VRFTLSESDRSDKSDKSDRSDGSDGSEAIPTIPLPVPEMFRVARSGDRLLIDDGSIEMSITCVQEGTDLKRSCWREGSCARSGASRSPIAC